jgi:hypothetical protein
MFFVQLAETAAAKARNAIDRTFIFATKQRPELETGKYRHWGIN